MKNKKKVEPAMGERKEIGELIALYSFEPNLKDVYVEGPRDKSFFEWFLCDQRISGVNVYEIDTINVPAEVLKQYSLNSGCSRSRVIALSNELSDKLPGDHSIICIVDRDHEDYLPSGNKNPYLEFTDYTSTELYVLQRHTLRKFIDLVLGRFPLSVDKLIDDLTIVLENVFLIRLSNAALGWNMEWIPFVKYVQVSDHLEFDTDRFTKAYLLKSGKWGRRTEYNAKKEELQATLKDDPRRRIRGHDLMDLLHYVITKLK